MRFTMKIKRAIKQRVLPFILRPFVLIAKPLILEVINKEIRVWGDPARLNISKKATMVNTLFNTISGCIEVGDYTYTGHNVSIITGSHQYDLLLEKRMKEFPRSGRDIIIGKGVWIGSNATILGPCKIGNHSVIAAGSVVVSGSNIPIGTVVAGIPAKPIKTIEAALNAKSRAI